jgi:hypothetical protein
MLQIFISFIAAFTVTFFAIRGEDAVNLVLIAGVVWAVASVLGGAGFFLRPNTMFSNRVWAGIGLAWLLTATVVFTRWPIRLGPVLYRSQFQALADGVAAGHPFTTPKRIGPFTFQRGEIERGFVCLWTDLNPNGRSGYIRGAYGDRALFNVWSIVSTGRGWHFLIED